MFFDKDQTATAQVRDFVTGERMKSLSDREWKFRLAGYGYALRKANDRFKLVALVNGAELCDLPLERPAA